MDPPPALIPPLVLFANLLMTVSTLVLRVIGSLLGPCVMTARRTAVGTHARNAGPKTPATTKTSRATGMPLSTVEAAGVTTAA